MPLVRRGPGLVRGAGRVAVGVGVANRVTRRQEKKWAAQDAAQNQTQPQQAPSQSAPEIPPPAASSEDMAAQLRQLGDLRAQGILSEAEFEAAKRKLIGGG